MSYSSKSFRLRREQNLSDEAEGSYSETSVRITMSYSSKSFRVRREQNLSDEDEGSDSETSSYHEPLVSSSEKQCGKKKSKDQGYVVAGGYKQQYYTPENQKRRSSRLSCSSRDGIDDITGRIQNISLKTTPEAYKQCRPAVQLGWYGPSPRRIDAENGVLLHLLLCFLVLYVSMGIARCKTDDFSDFLKRKTGVDLDTDQSGIYYFSHNGRQKNPNCEAKKCHYIGKSKNLRRRISDHFNGHSEFDKCLQWDDPSNNADHWNLTIWPFPEGQLTLEEKNKIIEKNSKTPNGHNLKS